MSKDVKKMVGEIRQSLEAYPREQLVEILAYVFKEYVVEGAAPIAGTTALIDARTELEGLSFAELMTWLQLHLDVPELAQFEVQGSRVSVRAGGRAIAIDAAAPPPAIAAPQPAAPAATSPPPAAAPSVTTRPMPATPTPPVVTTPPQAANPSQPANPPAPANAPAAASPPAAQPAGGEKKDEPGSPASRFSWLEVD